ncbi:MAG TPA: NADH-quinone oxidoreductase subunit C [bacterium]|nr:NADH-quinone oxidoreductase subunit C [bacterium]
MHKMDEFLSVMDEKIGSSIRKKKRLYFDVDNVHLREVVEYLFHTIGCRLSTATAMEVYNGIEVLYHFSDDDTGAYYCPRVLMTDKENPRMNSVTPIVKGAEWIEREMMEYWGITFDGHPRPERLLSREHPQNLDQPYRFRRMP